MERQGNGGIVNSIFLPRECLWRASELLCAELCELVRPVIAKGVFVALCADCTVVGKQENDSRERLCDPARLAWSGEVVITSLVHSSLSSELVGRLCV